MAAIEQIPAVAASVPPTSAPSSTAPARAKQRGVVSSVVGKDSPATETPVSTELGSAVAAAASGTAATLSVATSSAASASTVASQSTSATAVCPTSAGAYTMRAFVDLFTLPEKAITSSKEFERRVSKAKAILEELGDITSSKAIERSLSRIRATLDAPDDVEKCLEAMKELRGLSLRSDVGSAKMVPVTVLIATNVLRDPRSMLIKDACVTIAFMAQQLKKTFGHCAEIVLPELVRLLASATKPVALSAVYAIRYILKHTRSARNISLLASWANNSKAPIVRRRCLELLEWLLVFRPVQTLGRLQVKTIRAALAKGTQDANEQARTVAKRAIEMMDKGTTAAAADAAKSAARDFQSASVAPSAVQIPSSFSSYSAGALGCDPNAASVLAVAEYAPYTRFGTQPLGGSVTSGSYAGPSQGQSASSCLAGNNAQPTTTDVCISSIVARLSFDDDDTPLNEQATESAAAQQPESVTEPHQRQQQQQQQRQQRRRQQQQYVHTPATTTSSVPVRKPWTAEENERMVQHLLRTPEMAVVIAEARSLFPDWTDEAIRQKAKITKSKLKPM